jgi:hypothetical protein
VSDRTYAPDSESTAGFPRAALPDDPNEEMRLARPDGGDDPLPPNSAAMFPEIFTWTDEQLILAIELADRREPGLNLYAVGGRPDRHEAYLDACSAELVGRLERRGEQMAA